MKVSNEQAKDAIEREETLREHGMRPALIDQIIADYAADLLDAREEVEAVFLRNVELLQRNARLSTERDNAEEVIREMRGHIDDALAAIRKSQESVAGHHYLDGASGPLLKAMVSSTEYAEDDCE